MTTKQHYYKVRHVSAILNIPASTLRHWEKEFPIMSPKRTDAGQRLYSDEDVEICKLIKKYLYEDGLTIKAVKRKSAMFRKYSPRNAFVCNSIKDAVKLLADAKEKCEDEHIIARIESVLTWLSQSKPQS